MSTVSSIPEIGSFLIAAPTLTDPNFRRSVVLICEHNDEGSLGLVVNRPLRKTLSDVLPDHFGDRDAFGPLLGGGPVEASRMLALRRTNDEGTGYPIMDGVELVGAMEEALAALTAGTLDLADLRFFLGYAGWGSTQLTAEIEEGSWIVRSGTLALTFDTSPDEIWAKSLRELGGVYAVLADMPEDSGLN